MVNPIRTLLYELFVDPFAQAWNRFCELIARRTRSRADAKLLFPLEPVRIRVRK